MIAGPSALSGFRVLDLGEDVAGEYCGKLLADFGAEVIKVERPGGSPVRALTPLGPGSAPENSALFAYLNTNKKSVVIDVESEGGAALLAQLVKTAHVVIDDHKPGWLAAHGLHPKRLAQTAPDLVLCSITHFGQNGENACHAAQDINSFHSGGWGFHTPGGNDGSRPPLKGAGRYLVSYEAALDAGMCIVAALFDRENGARGRFIDISKKRVMYSRLDYVLAAMLSGDMDVNEAHTALDLGGPATILPCKDGFVYVWLSDEPMWQALREMIGEADWMDEDFPHNWLQVACTPDRVARTRMHLTKWLAGREKHAVAEEAQQRGVMIVPVNNPEDLIASPQFQHRGFFKTVVHPVLGEAQYPTVPYRMSATPAAIRAPAPSLGADNQTLLSELRDDQ